MKINLTNEIIFDLGLPFPICYNVFHPVFFLEFTVGTKLLEEETGFGARVENSKGKSF